MEHSLNSPIPTTSHERPQHASADNIHDAPPAQLPLLGVDSGQRQRRWTILLRLILVLPHLVVLTFAGIVAGIVRLLGWLCALILGHLPAWCGRFLGWYLSYVIRVNGYAYLLVDRYPPIRPKGNDYPVRTVLPEPTPLNRWAVLFRTLLALPMLVLSALFGLGWAVAGLFIWIIVLVLGRMPAPIFQASNAILRVTFRTQAYHYLLTPEYPKSIFGDPPAPHKHSAGSSEDTVPAGFRIHVPPSGRALMVAILVLGIAAYCVQMAASLAIADMNHTEDDSVVATDDQGAVIAAVSNYYRAVAADDGELACAKLSPALAQSLAAQAHTDGCPGAVHLTHDGQPQARFDQIANIKYAARDAEINGNQASLKIYAASNGSATLAQEVLLEKQADGQWLIVSLG
ncbi:DUF4389 domain-containing protein [Aldersonia kunmingensis]|uniref:DUF4389 domain-containing protein n=1 Tax=Aldersonia kunmingensis TaxID=408066 RepID=UPI00247FE8A7|nr:DUF4389 domain-containing protein [Aldersonia kunmingensis]